MHPMLSRRALVIAAALVVPTAAMCTYAARESASNADLARELVGGEQRAVRASARLLIKEGFDAYDRLSDALSSDDWRVRQGAVFGLAILWDDRAIAPIVKALADRDVRVRMTAVAVSDRFRSPQTVDALFHLLKDSDQDVRAAAALTLISAPNAKVKDALATLLTDPSPKVRLSAASSLAEMGDTRAIPVLVEDMRSPIVPTRPTSTSIWPTVGPDSSRTPGLLRGLGDAAVEPLVELARSGDRGARIRAISALGGIRDERTARVLAAAAKDPDLEIRYQALLGLHTGIEMSIALCTGENPTIAAKRMTIFELKLSDDPKAVDELIRFLDDPDVTGDAAAALGAKKDRRASRPLVKALRRSMADLGRSDALLLMNNTPGAVLGALSSIGDPDTIPDIAVWLRKGSPIGRQPFAGTLASMGKPGVTALLSELRAGNADVRRAIASVLGGTPKPSDPRIADAMIGLLHDPDASVVTTTANALAVMKDPEFVDALIPLLHSADVNVASSAIHALAELKDRRCVDPLISVLTNKDLLARADKARRQPPMTALPGMPLMPGSAPTATTSGVMPPMPASPDPVFIWEPRSAALDGLGRIRDPYVADRMLEILADQHSPIRVEAAKVVERRNDARTLRPLVTMLRTGTSKERTAAAWALWRLAWWYGHRAPDASAPLMEAARSSDRSLRASAVRALAEYSDPRAAGSLLAALDSGDEDTRLEAAIGLGKIRDKRAMPKLIRMLESKSDRLGAPAAAAVALGEMGDRSAVEPLVGLMNHELVGEYTGSLPMVIQALEKLRDPRAIKPLMIALILTGKGSMGGWETMSWHADIARALWRIGGKHVEDTLMRALRDQDVCAVAGACEFFISRGVPGSDKAMIEALDLEAASELPWYMLNSGNDQLIEAAKRWAAENRRDITKPYDRLSHGQRSYPRWGSGCAAR